MSLQTKSASTLIAQAQRLTRKGQIADAAQTYRDVLTRFPANRRAQEGLRALDRPESLKPGQVTAALRLYQQGAYAKALRMASALHVLDTDNLTLLEIMAGCHRHLGAPDKAVLLYDRALAIRDNPAFKSAKGSALLEMGRLDPAARLLENAVAQAPEDKATWLQLSRCRLQMGHPKRALDAAEQALSRWPDDPAALVQKGQVLLSQGHVTAAQNLLEASLGRSAPDHIALAALSELARATGDRPGAVQLVRRALAHSPAAPGLHRNLSLLHNYVVGDPHITEMQTRLKTAQGVDAQSQFHFALFNAFDQLDQRQIAFGHLVQGNRLRRAFLRPDSARDVALFPWLRSLEVPPAALDQNGEVLPIFITGLPRSGTTLSETLLARHTGATPAGELPVVTARLTPVLQRLQAEKRTTLSEAEVSNLARSLREDLVQNARGGAAVIDKMPLNFRYLGLLMHILPEARFIHLTRDPMANGWSLLRQCFGSLGNSFAYDETDIARFMALERAHIMALAGPLGSRLMPLTYETLIADTKATTAAMAAHCGLAYLAQGTDQNRAILTASTDQVRQPIRTDTNLNWQRYQPMLTPLAQALATAGLVYASRSDGPSQTGEPHI